MTARLLYLMKRVRPDIELVVSFMNTQVSKSDEDYWKNLKRVLMCVNSTIEDKRVILVIIFSEVFTKIDVGYDVHYNIRIHTSADIWMGYGIIHVKSLKQHINVKSLTKAEVVGMSDSIPYYLWLVIFLK